MDTSKDKETTKVNPQLEQAKEDLEPKLAGLQALMNVTTDTETRDALQAEISLLATKLSQVNAAISSAETADKALKDVDLKADKVQVSERVLEKLQTDIKNMQAAMTLFEEKKIEKEELKKEENLEGPAPPPPQAEQSQQQSRRV